LHTVHQVIPYLTAIVSAATLYLLFLRSSPLLPA